MRYLILLLSIALLGCAAAPVKINYYLLNPPKQEAAVKDHKTLAKVILKQVNIADYLRQPNLVILLAEHTLYYSPQDVWAESLQSSLSQALLQDLNHAKTQHYIQLGSPLTDEANTSISIDLAHFHSTHLSTVVISGRYWLSTNNKADENVQVSISEHSFYYELDLQQDGFAHAVDQLRASVTLLAQQIEQDIAALAHN